MTEALTVGSWFDRMRHALGRCTFLPGSAHKRFARQVSAMPLEKITEAQRRHVIRLAWRYRRQMPRDLVPSKDAVEAMDAERNARQAMKASKTRGQHRSSDAHTRLPL
jgi:ABC-type phosphonate transport system ATPase subunit